jgi:hypothetical protein
LSDKIKEIKEGIDDDGDIKIYTWWCNLLARIRGGEALPLWDRLPVGLVSVLNERGYLKFEGDSEVKKECYIKGIDLYIEELKREKKDVFLKSKVISLADKLALEKKVSDIDIWIENGRSLSRELIPEFLRIAGFGNGLKLLTIEYLKLIIAGKI